MGKLATSSVERLRAVADGGGKISVVEGQYDDLARAGLVETQLTGGGWGYTEEIWLTEAGRKALATASSRKP